MTSGVAGVSCSGKKSQKETGEGDSGLGGERKKEAEGFGNNWGNKDA